MSPENPPPVYGLGRKLAASAFILAHGFFVLVWVLPSPSPVKDALKAQRLPLPEKVGGWTVKPRWVVDAYMFNTGQWQDWSMFAPDPLQVLRYVAADVTLRSGARAPAFEFPRLGQFNFLHAWIEKRYRKYQLQIAGERTPAFLEDLARWVARQRRNPADPPVHVTLFNCECPIPRHDRPELSRPDRPAWIDYTRLLRDEAHYNRYVMLEYDVKPGDLGE